MQTGPQCSYCWATVSQYDQTFLDNKWCVTVYQEYKLQDISTPDIPLFVVTSKAIERIDEAPIWVISYTPLCKSNGTFSYMWKFSNLDFFKFLENLGLSNRSVGKHLCKISLKSTIALSTHWSLNRETSWFFDFKLEPTMCLTRQNMQ